MDEIEVVEKKQVQLSDLSPQHQTFVMSILQYKTQVRAYMDAFPETNYDTAMVQASILIRKPNVQEVIDRELDQRAMQAREIIDRQGGLARANMGDFVEMKKVPILDRHGDVVKDGETILYNQVPMLKEGAMDRLGFLVKRLHPANGGGVSIELHSVQDALSAMERIRRLISDQPTQVNIEQVVVFVPDNGRGTVKPSPAIDLIDVEADE